MTIPPNIRRLPFKVESLLLPLSIAVVVATAAMFYLNWDLLRRSRTEGQRMNQVARRNDAVLSILKDLEIAQRGYLLTGDQRYLPEYQAAKKALPDAISTLSAVVVAPEQVERGRKLPPLIRDAIAEVDETLAMRDQQGTDAAAAQLLANGSQKNMDEIDQLGGEIRRSAYAKIGVFSEEIERHQNQLRNSILAGCAILAAFLGFSLQLIRMANRRREQLIRDLDDARIQLHVTLSSIGDGVVTSDSQGRVVFLNPVAEQLTGWALADATGQTVERVFPIFHELTGEVFENPARRAMRERRAIEVVSHASLVRRDGSKLAIDDSAAPILDSHNRLTGAVVVFRDMTGRREVGESLKRWGHVFQHAGFGMALFSPGEKPILEQVNPAFAAMHGYEPEEMNGKPYSMVVSPELWAAKIEALSGVAGDHVLTETMHVRKDGSRFPALSDITLVRGERGEIIYCTGYYSDISDRRRAEQELRASEERYRTTADSLPQLVWTSGADGTTEYLNNRWYEDTGLTLESAGLQGWTYFLDPEDRERCLDVWQRSLLTGETFQTECRFRKGDSAKPRWYTCRAVPIRAADGHILRWFGSCTDVHEQREATELLQRTNEALRRSNLDLEQFAYAASHDLQEPLRMVVIYSQLLREEYGDKLSGRGTTYIAFAADGALRMENLLKDLLSYARAGATDEQLNELSDSDQALQSACTNLAGQIRQSGAQITTSALPRVAIPEVYLTQIFQNLLSNSLKYKRPDIAPVIRVEALQQKGMWLFSVSDNGIGVAAEHQKQIFRVFGRLHGQDVPGTGIGLALCQRLVERNGGRIWIESEAGQGATFFFTIAGAGDRAGEALSTSAHSRERLHV
jgi:PAS domain S-box-containing protein